MFGLCLSVQHALDAGDGDGGYGGIDGGVAVGLADDGGWWDADLYECDGLDAQFLCTGRDVGHDDDADGDGEQYAVHRVDGDAGGGADGFCGGVAEWG